MSVRTEHTAVVLMLCVTTPRDSITALAKTDFMEME